MIRMLILLLTIFTLTSTAGAQVIVNDFLVNNTSQNTQGVGRTAIAVAANGNFAVAWQDYNEYGIPIPAMPRVAVQMYSGNLTPIGPLNLFNGESRAAVIYDQDYLTGEIDMEFLPNGILLVAVEHDGLVSTFNTFVPSFEAGIGWISAAGEILDILPGTGIIGWLNPLDLVDWGNLRLDITPAGSFIGVYNGPTHNTDFSAVLIQNFDANGNLVDPYFTPHINDQGPNNHHIYPDIGTNGTIHLVAWQDGSQEANYDISAQFYSNTALIGDNITVNSGDPQGTYNLVPSVAMNPAGQSVVVWVDTRLGTNGEIFGQRFTPTGQTQGSNFQISMGEGVIYDRPEVALRNDGSFMVVWTDSLPGGSGNPLLHARARQFDGNGNPTGLPFVVPDPAIPSGLVNISTNGSHYYCSWLDARINNVTANVYAKIIGDMLPSSVEPVPAEQVPARFQLGQNYPNPFNPSTTIPFDIPNLARVVLTLYDITGNQIGTLLNEELQAGEYRYQLSGNEMASGVYFYRMTAISPGSNAPKKFAETRKFILLK